MLAPDLHAPQADLRCGLEAGLLAAASFAGFLPSIGISISRWPLAAFLGFLAGLPPSLTRLPDPRSAAAPQVDHVAARGPFAVIGLPARFRLTRSISSVS